ncbi:MAG: hypothetical protein KC643_16335 [Nitrospira sp.]|nr:hypothetical protein [Nitrospira sp.]MDR4487639.1 hypothetical protein [Nitrospirales bacterium]
MGMKKFHICGFWITCLALLLLPVSCGESKKDKDKWEEQKRVEQAAEKQFIRELERKYNALYFPAEQLGGDVFTYSLQKTFEQYANHPIIFKGFLEDIEAFEATVVAEFSVIFGSPLSGKESIYFRLTIPDRALNGLLEGRRADPHSKSIRFLLSKGGDYFVVADVGNIQKIPTYEIDGSKNGEIVAIKGENSRRLFSTGQLLEATLVKKE